MDLFTRLNHEGKTIIMVTHEKEVADFSNRRILIKDGRMVGGDSFEPF